MIGGIIETVKMVRNLGLRKTLKLKKSSDLAKEFLQNFVASHVIFTLFNVGFFDEYREKNNVNIKLFSRKNKLDERVLRSLCNYLYSLKILRRKGSIYSLDSKGLMLVKMAQGLFDVWYGYQPVLYNLEFILKKEKEFEKGIGRREKYVGKGSGEIGKLLVFPIVAKIIKKYRIRRVLDLGCGSAEFLIGLCKSDQSLLGYGIDISPEVVAFARDRIGKENLDNRIKIYEGDVFKIDKMIDKLNVDALTSFFVLHEFLFKGKKKIIEFFKRCKKSFNGKHLIVCEYSKVPSEELRKKPFLNLDYQLIHELTNQGLLSRQEWKEIFRITNYRIIEEMYFNTAKLCIFIIK